MPAPDSDSIPEVRRRAVRRRTVNRAIAWKRHLAVSAGTHATRTPGRSFNRLEARMARLLDSAGIDYQWQFRLPPYVYDFRVPAQMLLEVHGTWWHADPRFHPPGSLAPSQRNTVVRDLDKRRHAASSGYRLVVVWEHDLLRGKVDVDNLLGRNSA